MARETHTIKILLLTHWKIKQIISVSRESVVDFVERLVEEEARKLKVKYREKKKVV